MKIGIIGFGLMGSSLFEAAQSAGHEIILFVRDNQEKTYLGKK